MKQTLNKISNALLAIIFISLAMLTLAALTSSCTRKIKVQGPPHAYPEWDSSKPPSECYITDTLNWIPFSFGSGTTQWFSLDSLMNSKVVVDTIIIAGEAVEIHDTIPCPEGLTSDSIVYRNFTRYLPSRSVPVSITVMDTIWLTKPCPPCPVLPPVQSKSDGLSGERIAWISSVLALLIGYWRQWRNQRKTSTVG